MQKSTYISDVILHSTLPLNLQAEKSMQIMVKLLFVSLIVEELYEMQVECGFQMQLCKFLN